MMEIPNRRIERRAMSKDTSPRFQKLYAAVSSPGIGLYNCLSTRLYVTIFDENDYVQFITHGF